MGTGSDWKLKQYVLVWLHWLYLSNTGTGGGEAEVSLFSIPRLGLHVRGSTDSSPAQIFGYVLISQRGTYDVIWPGPVFAACLCVGLVSGSVTEVTGLFGENGVPQDAMCFLSY